MKGKTVLLLIASLIAIATITHGDWVRGPGEPFRAHAWNHNDSGTVITIPGAMIFVNMTSWNATSQNAITFVEETGAFRIDTAGVYHVNWQASFSANANSEHGWAPGINGIGQADGHGHRSIKTTGAVGSVSGIAEFSLSVGDEITLMVRDENGVVSDAIVVAAQLDMERIGD